MTYNECEYKIGDKVKVQTFGLGTRFCEIIKLPYNTKKIYKVQFIDDKPPGTFHYNEESLVPASKTELILFTKNNTERQNEKHKEISDTYIYEIDY